MSRGWQGSWGSMDAEMSEGEGTAMCNNVSRHALQGQDQLSVVLEEAQHRVQVFARTRAGTGRTVFTQAMV